MAGLSSSFTIICDKLQFVLVYLYMLEKKSSMFPKQILPMIIIIYLSVIRKVCKRKPFSGRNSPSGEVLCFVWVERIFSPFEDNIRMIHWHISNWNLRVKQIQHRKFAYFPISKHRLSTVLIWWRFVRNLFCSLSFECVERRTTSQSWRTSTKSTITTTWTSSV